MKAVLLRIITILVFFGLLSLGACKEEEEDSVTSSTGSGTTGPVTLRSVAITQSANRTGPLKAVVSDFQFCITQLRMVDGSGTAQDGGSGSGAVQAILGLVDVSGGTAVDWGTLDIPVGFQLSLLTLEVHKDPENCSAAEFSLSYNGTQLNQDLEFSFTFDPAITLGSNDVLGLSLDNIITVIEQAQTDGALTDEGITAYVEQMSGTGSEEVDGDGAIH